LLIGVNLVGVKVKDFFTTDWFAGLFLLAANNIHGTTSSSSS